MMALIMIGHLTDAGNRLKLDLSVTRMDIDSSAELVQVSKVQGVTHQSHRFLSDLSGVVGALL